MCVQPKSLLGEPRAAGENTAPAHGANAGGVTVSYFEWAQNIQQFRWEEERVNTELKKTMSRVAERLRAVEPRRDPAAAGGLRDRVAKVERADVLRGYV